MTKKRHQKDKLYLIPSEYASTWGGYKAGKRSLPFSALPFYCCGLTFVPFKDPVCVVDGGGIIFDKAAILSWLTTYEQNPVTGKPLSVKDLIPLNFYKNAEGEFACPVTYKVFSQHTNIVANTKSGYVYSKEAIDEICRRGKLWLDLMTDEPFTSKDLITIQDPQKIETRQIERFEFVRKDVDTEMMTRAVTGRPDRTGTVTQQPTQMMRQTLRKAKESGEERKRQHMQLLGSLEEPERPRKKFYSDIFTTADQASSLTSTAVTKKVGLEFRELTDEEVRSRLYEYVKKQKLRSYVTLVTNFGKLKLELRSDLVPETCHNFLLLCQLGKYDDTIFHRLIPNFMIQGGDPEGSGKGGRCAFQGAETFKDEYHSLLRHDERGVLSMANSGLDTNRSQFFITFAPCEHLDELHSVFGKVVGGSEVLDRLEQLPTDKDHRPLGELPRILSCIVYGNAFTTAEKARDGEAGPATREERQRKEIADSADFIRALL